MSTLEYDRITEVTSCSAMDELKNVYGDNRINSSLYDMLLVSNPLYNEAVKKCIDLFKLLRSTLNRDQLDCLLSFEESVATKEELYKF